MDFKPNEIINEIKSYKRKVNEMDDRVKKYLSDRKKNPYPGHENLINEIHAFENKVHKLPNGDIHFWLDGLLHSLMVHQRIWRVAFEKNADSDASGGGNIPIDRLYRVAKKKWDQLGMDSGMTKEDLLNKVRPEYDKAVRNLKSGEKITWSINKETHEVQVKVEKNS